jgi:hypothetical protein
MPLVPLLQDISTQAVALYTGIASASALLVQNPTPYGGGPAVTAYLGYTSDLNSGTVAFTLAGGDEAFIPLLGAQLFAVAEAFGLLITYVYM